MDFIINYWYVIVGILAVLVVAVFAIYHFFGLPTEKQLVKIKEWLKYAVALAEQELGGGTGQLKLRFVYDLFMDKFSSVAKIISFELFSKWVDEALIWLEKQLETNEEIKAFIEGD